MSSSTLLIAILCPVAWASIGGMKDLMTSSMTSMFNDMVKSGMDQVKSVVQDSQKEITGSVNLVKKSMTSKLNNIMDIVDENALVGIFEQKVPDLKTGYRKNTCVEGIKIKVPDQGTLTTANGKLRVSRMKIVPLIKDDLGENFLVQFSFNFTALKLEFTFFMDAVDPFPSRPGSVDLLQRGPSLVQVFAQVPKSRGKVDSLINKNECFLHVQKVEVIVDKPLEVVHVNYDSFWYNTLGVGHTEGVVTDIILQVAGEIQVNVKKALKVMVNPITSANGTIFCENDLTKPEELNCKVPRYIGKVDSD